ncbi:MAG TPA: DUF1566 domain-containing protein [Candidatus Binatia bacterium]
MDALTVLKAAVGIPIEMQCGVCTTLCGNGLIDPGEECDGNNLAGATCVTEGSIGGTLVCSPNCLLDTSGCSFAKRFDASGPTIIDHSTGLEWEKKDGAGAGQSSGPHDVDNLYSWGGAFGAEPEPNGSVFTDFLAELDDQLYPHTGHCYAGHCDWRLPSLEELQGIVVPLCPAPPCVIDPAFLPSPQGGCWTNDVDSDEPYAAVWAVSGWSGTSGIGAPQNPWYVRAVRSTP